MDEGETCSIIKEQLSITIEWAAKTTSRMVLCRLAALKREDRSFNGKNYNEADEVFLTGDASDSCVSLIIEQEVMVAAEIMMSKFESLVKNIYADFRSQVSRYQKENQNLKEKVDTFGNVLGLSHPSQRSALLYATGENGNSEDEIDLTDRRLSRSSSRDSTDQLLEYKRADCADWRRSSPGSGGAARSIETRQKMELEMAKQGPPELFLPATDGMASAGYGIVEVDGVKAQRSTKASTLKSEEGISEQIKEEYLQSNCSGVSDGSQEQVSFSTETITVKEEALEVDLSSSPVNQDIHTVECLEEDGYLINVHPFIAATLTRSSPSIRCRAETMFRWDSSLSQDITLNRVKEVHLGALQGSSHSESPSRGEHSEKRRLDVVEIGEVEQPGHSVCTSQIYDESLEAFRELCHLANQQRNNTEDKTYQGTEYRMTLNCAKTFNELSGEKLNPRTDFAKNSSQVRLHMKHHKIHIGENPYRTDELPKAFTESEKYKPNKRGEKPYQCLECEKTFTTAHSLKRHQKIHTGEKPYQCTECGKNFIRATQLKTHLINHTGEKPCQCAECGKTFCAVQTLRRHQRLHTGEKLYQCVDCGKVFFENGRLKQHQRKHMRGKKNIEVE
ncbi:zinc finger protein 3-like [Polypterus senegalus]|uniref:zinc finger protein 3-like n=1 Tax=Polypterus senegalus TaxID=55291 RepID=UPI0019630106|nr:zinc finger protein 3-like [Polypterus senegalus]